MLLSTDRTTEAYEIYPKMYYPRFHYTNPVTGLPVQYPTGIAATVKAPDSKLPLPSPPKNVKEFTARLTELERQIHSSIAYDAAENLVSAHGYYLDDSRIDGLQGLFSNTPDRGSLLNTEAANSSTIHQTVQPVIHVALMVIRNDSGAAEGRHDGRSRAEPMKDAMNRDGI